jgi:hypothetical protein
MEAYCTNPALKVPTCTARRPQVSNDARDCGREMSGNFAAKRRDFLHAANLRHGTDGITSPPKDYFDLKNPTISTGFEPANLGTRGQRASP